MKYLKCQISQSSPQALAHCDPMLVGKIETVFNFDYSDKEYPFAELLVGQSFAIPHKTEAHMHQMRLMSRVHHAETTLNRVTKMECEFMLIWHDDLKLIEVARIR